MYETVLIPTDGSAGMGSIIEQGIHQAVQNDAAVHAVYVIDVRSYMMLPDETGEQVAQLLKKEGQEAIETIRQIAEEAEIEFFGEVVTGVPHAAILEYVDENEIDLIVMGTHGKTGDQERIVGSVAEEVIRNADIPVLIAQVGEGEFREIGEDVPEEQQRYVG